MKIKQTILAAVLMIGVSLVALPGYANAINTPDDTIPVDSNTNTPANNQTTNTSKTKCGGTDTSVVECGDDGIWGLLILAINIMTAGIGIVAVAGIIWGSILYTTAGGSPEQTKQGMVVIRNVIIGIFMYLLTYAALNFLIPGGVFNSGSGAYNTNQKQQPIAVNGLGGGRI